MALTGHSNFNLIGISDTQGTLAVARFTSGSRLVVCCPLPICFALVRGQRKLGRRSSLCPHDRRDGPVLSSDHRFGGPLGLQAIIESSGETQSNLTSQQSRPIRS